MPQLLRPWLLPLLLLAAPTVASATTLDLRGLPSGVRWVAHVDLDAAKQASWADVAGFILIADPENNARLRAVREATEVDLLEDVSGLTFFGDWSSPEESAVAVRGSLRVEKLESLISEAPHYKSTQHNGRALHTFSPEPNQEVTVYFHDATLAVLSRNLSLLRSTVDVLNGKASALTVPSDQAIPVAPPGTILQIIIIDLSGVRRELAEMAQSPVMTRIRSGALFFGEEATYPRNEETFLALRLRAESPDVAADLRDALTGVLALARLHFRDQNDIHDALKAAVVGQDEQTVWIEWKWPTRDLIFAVQREILRRAD